MSVFSERPWTCPQCVHCTDTVFSVSILPSVLCSVEGVFQTLWPSLCTDNFLLDPQNLEGSYKYSKCCLHRWLGSSLELLLPSPIEDVLGLLSSMSSFVLSSHEVFCLEIFFSSVHHMFYHELFVCLASLACEFQRQRLCQPSWTWWGSWFCAPHKVSLGGHC